VNLAKENGPLAFALMQSFMKINKMFSRIYSGLGPTPEYSTPQTNSKHTCQHNANTKPQSPSLGLTSSILQETDNSFKRPKLSSSHECGIFPTESQKVYKTQLLNPMLGV